MSTANGFPSDDLPDSPHARQLRAGFPWLTFEPDLEAEFRRRNFDENLHSTRVNLCLAILFTVAFSAMDSTVLGPELNRIPSMIRMLIIVPMLLIGVAASFSAQRHRICTPIIIVAMTTVGLSGAAVQIIAALGGITSLFPSLLMTFLFIYLMGGLIFYHAVAANVLVMFVYLAAGTALMLPGR